MTPYRSRATIFEHMNITGLTSYYTRGAYYVAVDTAEGVRGVGECSRMHNDAVAQIMDKTIAPAVIGTSIFDTELLEERVMTRHYKISGQLLAMAFSGVEIAVQDARARAVGQPLYNLIGGRYRSSIPLYASLTLRNMSLEEECAFIAQRVAEGGFEGVKIKIGPRMGRSREIVDIEEDVKKVRAVRAALGPGPKLMIDANSSYNYIQAVRLWERVKEYDIYHFEEPCPYWDVETYVKLASTLPVAIHVGEQDWNLYTFRDFVARGACHLYAVDPVKCGGISNAKRAATLCRAHGVTYVPHNTSRGVGLASMLHIAASTPEFNYYGEYKINPFEKAEEYLVERLPIADGRIAVPEGPGLGIEIDWDELTKTTTVVKHAR